MTFVLIYVTNEDRITTNQRVMPVVGLSIDYAIESAVDTIQARLDADDYSGRIDMVRSGHPLDPEAPDGLHVTWVGEGFYYELWEVKG